MAKVNFNANEVAPAVAPEPVPTGWYPVFIEDSEMKEVEGKDGSYLELIMQIYEGEYQGRKLFARLNLQNQNPVAVEIAQRQLSAICHAVGVMQLQDSTQLHNKPFMARAQFVKAVLNEDNSVKYDAKNEVKGYKAVEGTGAPVAGAGGAVDDNVPDWVNEGTKQQPTPSTPAPPAAPSSPPPVEPEMVKVMTDKAAGATYEQFIEQGWSDEQMVEQGYMILEPAATPAPPAAPGAPSAPGAAAASELPPWMKK